jgi:hypothetical protein
MKNHITEAHDEQRPLSFEAKVEWNNNTENQLKSQQTEVWL